MRGIAEQHRAALQVPLAQVQGAEQAGRVFFPVAAQVRDQRQRIGEIAREQRFGFGTAVGGGEAGVAFVGQEQVTVKVPSSLGSAMHM